MPRTASQFEEIREQSRERIVRSALRLFARHGFAATSVRMIAEEAGVSQGLLYNYFVGKRALLLAIFERSMEDVQASFATAVDAPTPRQGLASLVSSALEIVREHQDFWRLSYQLRMQPDALAELGESTRQWAEAITGQIEALLVATGSPRAALEARVLFAAIDGAAQHYVLNPDGYPAEEVGEEIIRLFTSSAG